MDKADAFTKSPRGKFLYKLRKQLIEPSFAEAKDNHGFGCSPNARGRTVCGVNIYSGAQERWERSDILGVVSENALPAWAREKLAITDPPYASGAATQNGKQQSTGQKYSSMKGANPFPDFEGDSKDQRSWTHWMAEWLTEARRVTKDGAPICLFIDWRQLPSMTDALQWAGWIWRGTLGKENASAVDAEALEVARDWQALDRRSKIMIHGEIIRLLKEQSEANEFADEFHIERKAT